MALQAELQVHSKVVLHCLTFNIIFVSKHVPWVTNKAMDGPSCFQFHRFPALVLWGLPHQIPVPEELWRQAWLLSLVFSPFYMGSI